MFHTKTGVVEASLGVGGLGRPAYLEDIRTDLPGSTLSKPEKSDGTPETDNVFGGGDGPRWELQVEKDGTSLEISRLGSLLVGSSMSDMEQTYSLKVRHAKGSKGPRAKELLDGLARDFLFDLDITYEFGLSLLTFQDARSAVRAEHAYSDAPARFPQLSYHSEGHSLHWYAMSATQFPLLQFLAYYQILEFYFSSFTRESVIRRVQQQLKNPRFDASNNDAV